MNTFFTSSKRKVPLSQENKLFTESMTLQILKHKEETKLGSTGLDSFKLCVNIPTYIMKKKVTRALHEAIISFTSGYIIILHRYINCTSC